jgi:hypothetical protein
LLREMVSMHESSTYQMILDEGAVAEAKKLLMLVGTSQFGPPDGRVATALEGINELTRLEELCVRLLRAENWQDLLELGPSRPRSTRRRQGS